MLIIFIMINIFTDNVKPLHMNDTGLDLLDQKDFIIEQAKQQYEKGEINKEQFDVSRYYLLCAIYSSRCDLKAEHFE